MPDSSRRQALSSRTHQRALPASVVPHEPEDFAVVGIGASAGGLEACRKFVGALRANSDMAFILVQHLDPNHESMMVDLLASHTVLTVRQAADGMKLEREHVYVIPPGLYLSVDDGVLRLSPPEQRHGARMPFDFLLRSMAETCGARAICVVLSGTGTDGSLGLKAVKEKSGLVIVQDPDEAGYDGMPRSAIATGAVDLVLRVDKMRDALAKYAVRMTLPHPDTIAPGQSIARDHLPEIIELLRTKTAHDFTLYKPGTLQRRIERRMGMAALKTGEMDRYLEMLSNDASEIENLGKDLLINVTSFFRDPEVFAFLAEKVIPELVDAQMPDRPLRIWISGCSTGEEAYSLTMLFHEHIGREDIGAAKRGVKLQVFASDVDPDAIASARDGFYPDAIAADVSPARLARFFTKEGQGYSVSRELRAAVVFTVQDVLSDPPFSRLDLVSCRNLLIYLLPEAQARAISRFHFALRKGGILLLGGAETIGDADTRFEVISKSARLYRHVGRSRPGDIGFSAGPHDIIRTAVRQGPAPSRQFVLAELCRRLVLEAYAPAAILINRKHECLFSLGPTERYLRVAPGQPTHDLFAMALPDMRSRLRSAIQQTTQKNARSIVAGGLASHNGKEIAFSIDVQPVLSDDEELLLICFVEAPMPEQKRASPASSPQVTLGVELEHELEATRAELHAAIHDLEISGEDQRAVNDEASSLNEELQSTNEELMTSKEELQSLNEELNALNTQLHETLLRQRTTSNDLQNVLYSTNVATIFLDTELNIRFFTPATTSLFSVISSDIGRPLADLTSLAADNVLLADARTVLQNGAAVEREIEARSGLWFVRRILPYRTDDTNVDGVVITFVDSTERRHAADALRDAKREADLASAAKSRFLAAASHDLRQPLQTLSLLQGLLARMVEGDGARKLIGRLDETLGVMTGMLNALLDITQIEGGAVAAEPVDFAINDLLERLRGEFADHAHAKGIDLRVVPCGLAIHSDPYLLEQMIRNLLSNALKYTRYGKVLLGCRRRKGVLSIEVWDTGIGIPESELEAIFEEYHQLDNATRERSRGLGLGLSIVQRLGKLLGHQVGVRSRMGKGSVFTIEVTLPPSEMELQRERDQLRATNRIVDDGHRTGAILIVEDDPEVRELLELLLKDDGHHTTSAPDGVAALALLARGMIRPDLILADYNLPNGLNGLQMITQMREKLRRQIPVIILTGDVSAFALRDIAREDCVLLNKPMKLKELTQVIQRLLPLSQSATNGHAPETASATGLPTVIVIDDDSEICAAIRTVFEEDGRAVESYLTAEAFLDAYRPGQQACVLIDAYLPGMSGLELLQWLQDAGHRLPAIMITGHSDVSMAVQAMKAGAADFIEKPIGRSELLASVERALEQSRDAGKRSAWHEAAASQIAGLTPRQREVMDMVLAGHPSKNIAADLGISQRTVENHRAAIMDKTGMKSLPALARLALAAAPRSE